MLNFPIKKIPAFRKMGNPKAIRANMGNDFCDLSFIPV